MPKLSRLELQIMEALWTQGPLLIRDILESFPERERPAYTTVQTMVYRLETKGAARRARKISNAHVFEAIVSRELAQRRLIDDFLALFGGRVQPLMSQLIQARKLTLDEIREAEEAVRTQPRKKA